MGYSELMGMAKVWPLKSGVKGFNASGEQIDLQPGVPGWVPISEAAMLEKEGKLQRMAGQTPQSLKKPTYTTATVKADDEDDLGLDDPVIAPKSKSPRRSKNYRRTDSVAADNE